MQAVDERPDSVRRQLNCPVGDNYLGRFSLVKIAGIYPSNKVKILSKAAIYVMAMTDTTMDLVNYGDVEKG